MSQKYLGVQGLIFTEEDSTCNSHTTKCEIAQSTAAYGHEAVKYWMHNNMVTLNGQKMGNLWEISSPLISYFQVKTKYWNKLIPP